MNLSHFTSAMIFAAVVSVVFGVTSRQTDRDRLLYGLYVFALFVAITFGAAWLMYWIHR